MNKHKTIITTIATLCVLVGLLAFGSAPAFSLNTHVFSASFGAASSTIADPYPLSKPTGVAVASNADVYIADPPNAWVEKFDPSGHLLLIFGKEVNKTAAEASGTKAEEDVCIIASGDTCQAGVRSSAPGGFESPRFIAVDNSTGTSAGDVYVADTEGVDEVNDFAFGVNNTISKFTAEGGLIESWGNKGQINDSSVPEGPRGRPTGLDGLAVDEAGNLWIVASNFINGATPTAAAEFDENSGFIQSQETIQPSWPVGVAIDGSGNLYYSTTYSHNAGFFAFAGTPDFSSSLLKDNSGAISGVAVDLSNNDFYVERHSSISHFVAPCLECNDPEPNDVFGAGDLTEAVGLAVDPATHDVFATATGDGRVDVFIPAVLPTVTTGSASEGANTSSTVSGTVNPVNTVVTECAFQYGETDSYGQTIPCEPAATKITGNAVITVHAELKGLKPNATGYHFRLVAANAKGVAYGQDRTFITASQPSIAGETFTQVAAHSVTLGAQVDTHALPTNYYFEYGTSEAYGVTTPQASLSPGSGPVVASIVIEGLLQPETTYHFRIVATNEDGTTPGVDMVFTTFSDFPGLPDGRGYELVSPLDSADGNVYLPSATKETLNVEISPFPMRASADGDAVEYVADPLARGGNGNIGGGAGNNYVASRGAGGGWSTVNMETPGLDGVPFEALFSSELSNSGTAGVPAGTHSVRSGEGLYDTVGGRSYMVSVLPDGTAVSNPILGSLEKPAFSSGSSGEELQDLSHVLSADGSRVFWTDLEAGADMEHVFVRVDDDRTVAVSVGAATFWTASVDGRYAFYTENGALWRFDVEDGSREEIAGEDAGVLGVIGTGETGEDGEYVYFVAQGVLAPGATQGNCSVTNTACNLYVRHDGATSFIATLSGNDGYFLKVGGIRFHGKVVHSTAVEGDWKMALGLRTAEVAPDGHSLVFMSAAKLTGYENSGVPEVYVYAADSGTVSCVSCNPTGERATTGGYVPASYNVTFMHRWVSEDGSRVFFDSWEGLVAQDTNERQDVYEWEREGTGDCGIKVPARQDGGCTFLLSGGTSNGDSYLLDTSANGNDVFMITRARLVPQDLGETYEVYDARVGAVLPPEEPACTGTGCQGLPAGPPLFATPSSVTFNGVGNFTVPTPVLVPSLKPRSVKCVKPKRLSHGKCVKTKTKVKGKRVGKSSRYGRTK